MVKNPPSNAGDAGSIPGQGTEIPHAMGQLSPRATTTEPVHPEPACHNWRRENPHATTREKRMPQPRAHTAMKDPACLNEDTACRN